MPAVFVEEQHSLVFVIGGSSLQREEIANNLKSFYVFRLFEAVSLLQTALASSEAPPTAIIIDEVLPPKGGANLIASMRNNENTKMIPVVFTADSEHTEAIAEATSYNNVFLSKDLLSDQHLLMPCQKE